MADFSALPRSKQVRIGGHRGGQNRHSHGQKYRNLEADVRLIVGSSHVPVGYPEIGIGNLAGKNLVPPAAVTKGQPVRSRHGPTWLALADDVKAIPMFSNQR